LVEQLIRNQQVSGSNPLNGSSLNFPKGRCVNAAAFFFWTVVGGFQACEWLVAT
jgi:hypothetical protein